MLESKKLCISLKPNWSCYHYIPTVTYFIDYYQLTHATTSIPIFNSAQVLLLTIPGMPAQHVCKKKTTTAKWLENNVYRFNSLITSRQGGFIIVEN